ncbi:hypothetical protein COCNU_14G009410 [Cocos nucifera]|uniref:Uncharacterized protein n=1 Tax=Cocos nucifera TaxID=13894 RepID=A0A8K0NCN2_COCNU|nr:hypothetical protein COCNU_14G009410 [Cocos nucifera]
MKFITEREEVGVRNPTEGEIRKEFDSCRNPTEGEVRKEFGSWRNLAAGGIRKEFGSWRNPTVGGIRKEFGFWRNLEEVRLLKESDCWRNLGLRKWNERWVILDPTSGKMEYKTRRNETVVKGTIIFDSNSTITLSPVNFHATQLVLRAHKEAVNSLSGNGSAKLGTVAAVVAAANSTAVEASKEIEEAMKVSMRTALGLLTNKTSEDHLDDLTIMKLRESEEKVMALSKEREILLKQRDSALQEAQLWRSELAKARERAVVLEAAVVRAEERARVSEADAEARIRGAAEKAAATAKEKEDLLALVNILQSQVQRFSF